MADEKALRQVEFVTKTDLKTLLDKDLSGAEKILRTCDNKRISIVTIGDSIYPTRLKSITDPPLVLYYEGKFPNVDFTATIAIVGTRKASGYGLKHAKELGYQLSRGGAVVVSGAAAGIDAMALEGALSGGSSVIAVLGNGTDVVYPTAHRRLYEDVKHHGCLISEFPPGTAPFGQNFPIRNRIISGLSCGVVVVEAPKRSGALITASRALDQGRDVFAIPADLGVGSFQGNLDLLKQGAILIENGADVLNQYAGQFPVSSCYIPADFDISETETPGKEKETGKNSDKKTVDNQNDLNYIDLCGILSEVSADGAEVLKILVGGEKQVDEIVELSGLPAARVSAAMTVLGIKKFVVKLPGMRFALAENIKAREIHE